MKIVVTGIGTVVGGFGHFVVIGRHSYDFEGTYTLGVTITEAKGQRGHSRFLLGFCLFPD